ncbi:proton-conducting transporter membrane subunit [Halorientalis brevis]|uniref:Proton-conducting transporter membrane subunit n=1 Tax=Halorientalis brevis TaxID=1126241 RepID=A0ABD6CIP0_9EURY|nr:proton-conducting transporter membrane subunit [Halorientalis brevis]
MAPILASGSRPNRREAWTFLAAGLTLALAAQAAAATLDGVVYETTLGRLAVGAPLTFRVDALGALFALLASFLWLVASAYSVGYMRGLDEHDQTRYFAAFAASIGATMGVALAANLLTLFVFYELLTVATYPLVAHAETPEARRAGRRYLAYTLSGGVAILGGIVLVYAVTGSGEFVAGGLAGLASEPIVATVAYGLLVVGFGVKAAVVPLHAWLPDAMVAPTPVSGLLHAVAVVKSGVFGLARVVLFVFGAGTVRSLGLGRPLAVAAAATMLLAGVVALRQDKLKRGLAYSTISQLSYIVLGIALLTPLALFGALLHLVAHAFMKITLFFCAGAIYVETDTEYVSQMGGIWRRLPALMTAFAVGSAGLVGLPGIAGFVSKWYLILGALDANALVFAATYLVAGLLKLLFFWPVLLTAYAGRNATDGFRPVDVHHGVATGEHDGGRTATWERRTPLTESSWWLLGPVLVTAGGAVVLGVVPDATPFWALARTVGAEVFPGG